MLKQNKIIPVEQIHAGNIMNDKRKYRKFEDARRFARGLKFKSRYDWASFTLKPDFPNDLPKQPEVYYKRQFKNWKDFLGYKSKIPFWSYEEAKQFVKALKLSGLKDWKRYANWDSNDLGLKPPELPSSPHIYYADKGWKGYADFLGTDNTTFTSKVFRSFESARKYCRALGLTSSGQWLDYCKGNIKGLLPKPEDIPTNIARHYTGYGFDGMSDFLNTAYHRKVARAKEFRTFKEAKRFVHSLKLKNVVEWNQYIKGELPTRKRMPPDIPSNPMLVYKDDGWTGFGDWLGTYNVPAFKLEFKSFKEARDFARTLGLKSSTEWIAYCKGLIDGLPPKPDDIPHSVARHYKDHGWVDYKDFLMDDERRASYSKFLPYRSAKAFVNKLGLKNVIQWQKYVKGELPGYTPKPSGIPSNPALVYKEDGWKGMGEWLDNGSFPYAHQNYRSYREARKFARSLGLITSMEWVLYCKGEFEHLPEKPIDIPANLVKQYKSKGWKGFKDFLGTKKNRDALKKAISYEDSKVWVRSLGISCEQEWKDFLKGKLKKQYGIKPPNIPSHPEVVYLRFGCKGIADWLGIT